MRMLWHIFIVYLPYVEKNMSIDDGAEFVYNKLQRSYKKLSNKGKEIILPHYQVSKILLLKK